MRLTQITKRATDLGDFYLHYRRFDNKGQTYLVGTTEFDNKYILNRLHSVQDPCGLPFNMLKRITATTDHATRLKLVTELAIEAEKADKVLVYTWSSDRFRVIAADAVTKLTPLAYTARA